MSTLFEEIRSACAQVAGKARSVAIDTRALDALAARLAVTEPPPETLDPAHHYLADDATTLAYVLTLDAINFGSGWFPVLRKRPGCSGYFTLASALRDRFEQRGAWSAAELSTLSARDCAEVLGQSPADAEVVELMELYARALRDLGNHLLERHGGDFAGPVAAAGGSAEQLVAELARMPLYRDVAVYEGLEVPFYKRAQLTVADLTAAFHGEGPGRFGDLGQLTLFADNLVPHVLRWEGVLCYTPELAQCIDRGERLAAGSPEEVEIRAVALHAVEGLVAATVGRRPLRAQQLDHLLWSRGQLPEFKSRPRHRTRSPYY